jgi:hypothetical protein
MHQQPLQAPLGPKSASRSSHRDGDSRWISTAPPVGGSMVRAMLAIIASGRRGRQRLDGISTGSFGS